MKVAEAIGRLGVGVLPRSKLLISFRRGVNVKIIEGDVFNVVGVLMTLAVVASETKDLVRLGDTDGQND